jgi:hypothetical protein
LECAYDPTANCAQHDTGFHITVRVSYKTIQIICMKTILNITNFLFIDKKNNYFAEGTGMTPVYYEMNCNHTVFGCKNGLGQFNFGQNQATLARIMKIRVHRKIMCYIVKNT